MYAFYVFHSNARKFDRDQMGKTRNIFFDRTNWFRPNVSQKSSNICKEKELVVKINFLSSTFHFIDLKIDENRNLKKG